MLMDVDLVSLQANVDKSTHWGSAAYLRLFHVSVHAKEILLLPGRPALSLLTGELTELANGSVIYVLCDSPPTCTEIKIRQKLVKANGEITLLVAPLLAEPTGPWLISGAKMWSLHLCEAMGAGCLFYREADKVII